MFVVAATFLFLHAAVATFLIVMAKKINTSLLTHTVMHFQSNSRRNRHIEKRCNTNYYFFHQIKVKTFLDKQTDNGKANVMLYQFTNPHCIPKRKIKPCVG